jgi:hypothetical protein
MPELGSSRVIAEDGKIVWAGGGPVGGVSVTETNGTVVFSNVSGAHTFAWVAKITPSDLCALTRQFVDSSPRYQSLTPGQKAVADTLITAACKFLTSIGPDILPAKKQAFIRSYDQSAQALVKKGWLTQAQADTLQALASTL